NDEFVLFQELTLAVEVARLELNGVVRELVTRVAKSDNPDRPRCWNIGAKLGSGDFDVTVRIRPVEKGSYSAAVLSNRDNNDDDNENGTPRNYPFTCA